MLPQWILRRLAWATILSTSTNPVPASETVDHKLPPCGNFGDVSLASLDESLRMSPLSARARVIHRRVKWDRGLLHGGRMRLTGRLRSSLDGLEPTTGLDDRHLTGVLAPQPSHPVYFQGPTVTIFDIMMDRARFRIQMSVIYLKAVALHNGA
jgi:hypothetical protein